MIYKLDDHKVTTDGDDFYVAETATVVGRVTLKKDASVWFGAVVRGDVEYIVIGQGSNVQDLSVIHADPGSPTIIGDNVTVGHKVMLHGCQIGNNSLIGINAVVLNGAKIGENCLIGANSLVTENTVIPDNSMFLVSPGKVVKTLGPEMKDFLLASAVHYVENYKRFKKGMSKDEN